MEQIVFNWAVAIAGFLGGWILKVIWDAIKELQSDLQQRDVRMHADLREIDTRMHNDFVRRDDFKEAVRDIKSDMKAGFDKVDNTLSRLFQRLDDQIDGRDV